MLQESENRPSRTRTTTTRKKPKKPRKPRQPSDKPSGFQMPVTLSPILANFFKKDVMPRVNSLIQTDVTKEMWKYIKEHNLQDPDDKRFVRCDPALQVIFESNRIHMFTMTKMLSRHMIKIESEGGPKPPKVKKECKSDQPNAFHRPVQLSPILADFFQKQTMPRVIFTDIDRGHQRNLEIYQGT